MNALVAAHGRLIVDNMEFRWLREIPHVFSVARIASAVNCGAFEPEVLDLAEEDVEAAAAFGHEYDVRPHARRLTPFTSNVPLLAYRRDNDGSLVLIDGRQRAHKAFMTRQVVKAYVLKENEAVRVGRHPASAEIVQLIRKIKDPALLDEVRFALKACRDDSIFTSIQELLGEHAVSTNNEELLHMLDQFAHRGGIHLERYKILETTGARPVSFDQHALLDRTSRRRTNQVVQLPSEGRPNDGFSENRVKLYYSYTALRLLAIEDEIRIQIKGALPPYEGKAKLIISDYEEGPGLQHVKRTSSYDAYLKAHWSDMHLSGPHTWDDYKRLRRQKSNLYLKFDAIQERASQIIRTASTFEGADDLRRDIKDRIASRVACADHAELLRMRDYAAYLFRLFVKAFVRMRQWRPARLQLLDMEAACTMPASGEVGRVARWDLDSKSTLVTLDEMIKFTELSGVVATDIWPLHLEYNPLFECYALLRGIQHRDLRVSVTAIESFFYRGLIRNNRAADDLTSRWDALFEKYHEAPNTTEEIIRYSFSYIAAAQGLDLFDRQDTPNGSDFKEQHISYFQSRLAAT